LLDSHAFLFTQLMSFVHKCAMCIEMLRKVWEGKDWTWKTWVKHFVPESLAESTKRIFHILFWNMKFNKKMTAELYCVSVSINYALINVQLTYKKLHEIFYKPKMLGHFSSWSYADLHSFTVTSEISNQNSTIATKDSSLLFSLCFCFVYFPIVRSSVPEFFTFLIFPLKIQKKKFFILYQIFLPREIFHLFLILFNCVTKVRKGKEEGCGHQKLTINFCSHHKVPSSRISSMRYSVNVTHEILWLKRSLSLF